MKHRVTWRKGKSMMNMVNTGNTWMNLKCRRRCGSTLAEVEEDLLVPVEMVASTGICLTERGLWAATLEGPWILPNSRLDTEEEVDEVT